MRRTTEQGERLSTPSTTLNHRSYEQAWFRYVLQRSPTMPEDPAGFVQHLRRFNALRSIYPAIWPTRYHETKALLPEISRLDTPGVGAFAAMSDTLFSIASNLGDRNHPPIITVDDDTGSTTLRYHNIWSPMGKYSPNILRWGTNGSLPLACVDEGAGVTMLRPPGGELLRPPDLLAVRLGGIAVIHHSG